MPGGQKKIESGISFGYRLMKVAVVANISLRVYARNARFMPGNARCRALQFLVFS